MAVRRGSGGEHETKNKPEHEYKGKKVKLSEGVWGSGRIDPYFLDLGTSRR
jgi:hypothetical protein